MFNLQKRSIDISAFPFLFTYQGVVGWFALPPREWLIKSLVTSIHYSSMASMVPRKHIYHHRWELPPGYYMQMQSRTQIKDYANQLKSPKIFLKTEFVVKM